MDFVSELTGLSDAADGIIRRGKEHERGLCEWLDLVKQVARQIADDDESNGGNASRKSTTKSGIPEVLPFVTRPEPAKKNSGRISAALTLMKKDHIVRKKRQSSRYRRSQTTSFKRRSSTKITPQPNCNGTFVKEHDESAESTTEKEIGMKRRSQTTSSKRPCSVKTTPEQPNATFVKNADESVELDGPKTGVLDATYNKPGDVSSNEDRGFYTPVGGDQYDFDGTKNVGKSERTSVKRKSSPMSDKIVKKVKVTDTVSVTKVSQKGKISENKFFKSRLPPAKISSSGNSSTVLKENRCLRSKANGDDGNSTLKKVKAARQTKIEEAKRKREEKMQKTSQQRQKLEKEKDERLRSRKAKETEKPLLKTALQNKKARVQESERNHNLEVQSDVKSLRSAKTNDPAKTPRKIDAKKAAEEVSKKGDLNTTYVAKQISPKEVVKADPPAKVAKNQAPATPVKTPRKAATKQNKAEETNKNQKEDLKKVHTTIPADQKAMKKQKVGKTPLPVKQMISNSTLNGSGNLSKAGSATPHAPPPLSYKMTPDRESFTNYDISEIKSDDSDSEEEKPANKKPVPKWATGIHLRNALIQQQYYPIDTDEVFGNRFDNISLADIMGVQSQKYSKRTSSAIWKSPSCFK